MKRREFCKRSTAIGGTSIGLFGNPTWTPWFWLNPEKKLEPEKTDHIDNLTEWRKNEFTYKSDPLYGLLDVSRDVDWIVKNKEGDCVDFTTIALSWLINEGYDDVEIIWVYDPDSTMWGGHIAAAARGVVFDYDRLWFVEDYEKDNLISKKKKIDISKVP